MLDGDETMEIALGELRQHAGRRGSREKSLRRAALARSETAFKQWKWLGESSMQSCWCGFFRTNVILVIVLKNCGRKSGLTVPTVSKG